MKWLVECIRHGNLITQRALLPHISIELEGTNSPKAVERCVDGNSILDYIAQKMASSGNSVASEGGRGSARGGNMARGASLPQEVCGGISISRSVCSLGVLSNTIKGHPATTHYLTL